METQNAEQPEKILDWVAQNWEMCREDIFELWDMYATETEFRSEMFYQWGELQQIGPRTTVATIAAAPKEFVYLLPFTVGPDLVNQSNLDMIYDLFANEPWMIEVIGSAIAVRMDAENAALIEILTMVDADETVVLDEVRLARCEHDAFGAAWDAWICHAVLDMIKRLVPVDYGEYEVDWKVVEWADLRKAVESKATFLDGDQMWWDEDMFLRAIPAAEIVESYVDRYEKE